MITIPYIILYFRPITQVDLLRPRDRRGKTLSAARETDLAVECKREKGFRYIFIKAGPSWVFNKAGKMITKFFGIEGTAYVGVPKVNEIERVSVRDFLVTLWGENFYKSVPAEKRRAVETDVIGITIEIEKINEEDFGLPTLTSEDLHDQGDSVVLQKIAQSIVISKKGSIIQFIMGATVSAAAVLFLVLKGWL